MLLHIGGEKISTTDASCDLHPRAHASTVGPFFPSPFSGRVRVGSASTTRCAREKGPTPALPGDGEGDRESLRARTRPVNKADFYVAAPRQPRSGVVEIGQALPAHVAARIAVKAWPHVSEIIGSVIMNVIAVRKALYRECAAGAAEPEAKNGE
jgi:hypothetical protein